MSNSEINALENVVRTIFLPEFCRSSLTSIFEFNLISFFGIEKCATTKKVTNVITWNIISEIIENPCITRIHAPNPYIIVRIIICFELVTKSPLA